MQGLRDGPPVDESVCGVRCCDRGSEWRRMIRGITILRDPSVRKFRGVNIPEDC
jgi:hypothetical protein